MIHKALGLMDYPSVIKKPMDLGTLKVFLVEDYSLLILEKFGKE